MTIHPLTNPRFARPRPLHSNHDSNSSISSRIRMLASISFVGSAALFTGCARLLQRDVDDAASDEVYHDAVDDLDDVERYSRLLSSDHEYGKHLRVAVEAALVAGRGDYYTHLSTAGTIYSTSLSTTSKSKSKSNTSDFFTEVDVANEKLIIERIKASFHSHAIIGEETSDSSTPQTISPPTWIIDPIDGTTNFVAGNPLTCVSICYAEKDEVRNSRSEGTSRNLIRYSSSTTNQLTPLLRSCSASSASFMRLNLTNFISASKE